MTTGVRDVDLKILEELNDNDLFNFCLTSKYGKKLCENEDFWRKRFIERFGYHEKNRSWKDFYLSLVYYLNKYDINQAINKAIEGGYKNIDLIQYFISEHNDKVKILNEGMRKSAQGGHRDLVNFFISKGANIWEWGMQGAAEGGHQNLVNFFISKGANWWNLGMRYAAKGGHQDLVNFFISKGANNWNIGMHEAARGGHKDLVDFFISKGANDWDLGMWSAAKGGHKNIVDFFISKGANDWDRGIRGAKQGGHQDLVEFFEKKL